MRLPAPCASGETGVVRRDDHGRAAIGGERARMSMISAPVVESRFPVGSSAKMTRGSTESARAIATRCCSPPERCDGRWVARSARPTSASSASPRRRESTVEKPGGASFASMFSSAVRVGIRLNCWKTNPNERRRSSARSPSRSCGEVAALEEDPPAGGAVERAEQLEQRRLAGSARAFEREELARLDAQVHVLERVDDERAAHERLADADELELAHSTVLRASAGRRRAARSAPAAPASRPPRTASRKPPSTIVDADRGGERDRVRGRARGLLDPEDGAAAVVELAVSVGPKSPIEEAAPTPSTTPRMPPSTPWRATRPRPAGRPCPASSRAPSACRARGRACRPTRARAAPRAGRRRRPRRSRARARGCARGRRRRRASR